MADEQTIKGGRQLFDFLQQLPVKLERNVMRAALRAGGNVIRDEARNNVPVKLGALKKSIRVSTGSKGGTVRATVKAGDKKAFYAQMVEYGTKPHLIKVDDQDRPVNYRQSAKLGRTVLTSIRTINRNSLRIGSNFVGPKVEHPGAKPTPYLRPAVDMKSGDAITAVGAKIRERLTKEGINVPAPEVD